ncbi:MAG: hypothetical protein K9H25_23165 [Rhodospirillum sp.]|nr:hypothetical protein [Rhodospirillum sp.]MCF8491395.1 hypothetical protein [Rhodospirillum sp.]
MNAIAFTFPSAQMAFKRQASAWRAIDFMDYGRNEWARAMADARMCRMVGDRGGLTVALERAIVARGFLGSALRQYRRATQ